MTLKNSTFQLSDKLHIFTDVKYIDFAKNSNAEDMLILNDF